MRTNYMIIALLLCVGITYSKGDYETTDWRPSGDQKFVDNGTIVITSMEGKTGHSITVGLGLINANVTITPEARSKDGWIIDKKITVYRLGSTGMPFGRTGIDYIEQSNGNFKFGFDRKQDESNNGKSTTLYGQILLTGKHQKTKTSHTDKGVSGKDTSVTITLKY